MTVVAYNFQDQFVADVEAGRKCQTIRKVGKRRHAILGDTVHLYTGMRTKACRLIGVGTCTASTPCMIWDGGITLGEWPTASICEFARADGFHDFGHMKQWFRGTYGLPFTGRLIMWRLNKGEST